MSPRRGLLDTSVVIGLETIAAERLPAEMAISALTLAELSAGPISTSDIVERGRRLDRVQRVEATFEAIAFDPFCARAYGRVYAAVLAAERKPRGARATDLMIAATALAQQIPLYTLDASDLRGLGDLIEIVDLA